jgi:hypothetical protein
MLGLVFNSLKTHPTLEVLGLTATYIGAKTRPPPVAPDVLPSRMEALVNAAIHTINVDPNTRLTESQLFLISR